MISAIPIDDINNTWTQYNRDLATFVGRAVSMERALGCIVRLKSRSAARLCAAAPHWEARVQLDELVIREMRFLRERALFEWSIDHLGSAKWCTAMFFWCQWYWLWCLCCCAISLISSRVVVVSRQSAEQHMERIGSSASWVGFIALSAIVGRALQWHCDNAAAVHIVPHYRLDVFHARHTRVWRACGVTTLGVFTRVWRVLT